MNDLLTQDAVQKECQTYADKAQELAVAIKDADSYTDAAEFLKTVKNFRKRVEDAFGPTVKAAHAAWKSACDLRKSADAPLDRAETILQPALDKFRREQERIRAEKEAKLREEARKAAEDQRIAEAMEAEKNGKKDEAQALMDAPVQAPVIVLPKATPKIEGTKVVRYWKVRVTNPILVPREYLVVDEQKLGQVARAMKEAFNVPGCEAYFEEKVTG